MSIPATTRTTGSEGRPATGRVLVALTTVLIAIAVGMVTLFASPASASPLTTAGNAVGVSHVAAGQRVGLHERILAGEGRARAPSYDRMVVGSGVGAKTEGAALNSAGQAYPEVLNPGTGEPIPYPGEGLSPVPVAERVPWGAQERGAFIKEWYDRGFSTPEGGWSNYDIHHIIPREYGGTNDFENLVPVERGVHQSEFNAWWRNY